MNYTIYLDKDETFECEATIRNASYKNSSARLIVEGEDTSIVFVGTVEKNKIHVPIKSSTINKLFTENDSAKIKLEVIVENTIVQPWNSDVVFDKYNKVEITEVKNVVATPLVEVKVQSHAKEEVKVETTESSVVQPVNLSKQELVESINEYIKKSNIKLTKEQRKEFIKKMINKVL